MLVEFVTVMMVEVKAAEVLHNMSIENYDDDAAGGIGDGDDGGDCQVCDRCSIYGEDEEGWEDAVVVDSNPDYE